MIKEERKKRMNYLFGIITQREYLIDVKYIGNYHDQEDMYEMSSQISKDIEHLKSDFDRFFLFSNGKLFQLVIRNKRRIEHDSVYLEACNGFVIGYISGVINEIIGQKKDGG